MKLLRRWLAQKLCPEAFENERRWHHAYDYLYELKWWCHGDFPEVSKGADWVLACVSNRFSDERRCPGACTIDQFREELRNQRRQETTGTIGPSRSVIVEALLFYARHEHWMSLTEDGPKRLLCAMKGKHGIEGWSVAEDTLNGGRPTSP